jgi:hypothetical protein
MPQAIKSPTARLCYQTRGLEASRRFVRMLVCVNCQHMAPLPVRDRVRRLGGQFPVEMALQRLRCEECRQSKVEARLRRPTAPA